MFAVIASTTRILENTSKKTLVFFSVDTDTGKYSKTHISKVFFRVLACLLLAGIFTNRKGNTWINSQPAHSKKQDIRRDPTYKLHEILKRRVGNIGMVHHEWFMFSYTYTSYLQRGLREVDPPKSATCASVPGVAPKTVMNVDHAEK